MWLALDDTDDRNGGCTTHAALHVADALASRGYATIGHPRLVRLNPNVPWKTRGNGAVCIELTPADAAAVADAAWQALQDVAAPEADPALAVFPRRPDADHYWAAVTGIVELESARAAALEIGAEVRGGGRGLVGCLAAAAWRGPPTSYELMAYRAPNHQGTPRRFQDGFATRLKQLDDAGFTFHSFARKRLPCIPASPCPVLVGLRGTDPEALRIRGQEAILDHATEPVHRFALWATNQASGDHVVPHATLADAAELTTVRTEAIVTGPPSSSRGGHVACPMADAAGRPFTAFAFEPTKHLRHAVLRLRPQARVLVTGAWKQGSIHLEHLRIDAMPEGPPICCTRRMKSMGRHGGHRCPVCRARAPLRLRSAPSDHEAPASARRHLHRPSWWV